MQIVFFGIMFVFLLVNGFAQSVGSSLHHRPASERRTAFAEIDIAQNFFDDRGAARRWGEHSEPQHHVSTAFASPTKPEAKHSIVRQIAIALGFASSPQPTAASAASRSSATRSRR